MVWTMLCLALCVLGLSLSASAQKHRPTYITFDAQGAGPDTLPFAVNDQGVIVGWVIKDANQVHYSFLRDPHGKITTVAVPDEGTDPCQGTLVYDINQEGAISGSYIDTSDVFHGFLRDPHGRITTFVAPDAGSTGSSCGGQGTIAAGINPAGTIGGWYADAKSVQHGFVRDPHGRITTFDAPGAGTDPGQGTLMNTWTTLTHCINPDGEITGWYLDKDWVQHGFVRDPHGRIKTFDAPGAGTGEGLGTMVEAINPAGAIVGISFDEIDGQGFLRDPHSSFTTFKVPGEGNQYTTAVDINPGGAITGWYLDADWAFHGFLRDKDGKITKIDVPGAQSTTPTSINSGGAITGWYSDANGLNHGFLRIP